MHMGKVHFPQFLTMNLQIEAKSWVLKCNWKSMMVKSHLLVMHSYCGKKGNLSQPKPGQLFSLSSNFRNKSVSLRACYSMSSSSTQWVTQFPSRDFYCSEVALQQPPSLAGLSLSLSRLSLQAWCRSQWKGKGQNKAIRPVMGLANKDL